MTNLSQAYRDTPLQLKDIIPLDFHNVHELPESHSWSTPVEPLEIDTYQTREHVPKARQDAPETSCVPIIDLKDPNIVELVRNACKTWGMFQVTNHGVSSSLLEDVEFNARKLFALPMEEKLKALRAPDEAAGYGVARIAPFFPKSMWHEGFSIIGSAANHAKKFWPHGHEAFCDVMDNYQKRMKTLGYEIFLIILKSLGLTQEDIQRATSIDHEFQGALQLNSYPSCPDPSRAMGLAPHTDSLILTILHQCDTNGLQTFRDGVGWTPVSVVPGALVVNIGDLMHILSNAHFPTVYHRVVPNRSRHRFSMAYFFYPSADSVVSPLLKLPFPRYQSLKVKEYIGLKNKYLEAALSRIRIEF